MHQKGTRLEKIFLSTLVLLGSIPTPFGHSTDAPRSVAVHFHLVPSKCARLHIATVPGGDVLYISRVAGEVKEGLLFIFSFQKTEEYLDS